MSTLVTMPGSRSSYAKQLQLAIDVAQQRKIPEQPRRLTRRKRCLIVDADFHGKNDAVVWFLRRGYSGEPVDDFWRMVRSDGVWSCDGGGGGTPGADLDDRPTLASIAEWNQDVGSECEFAIRGGGGSGRRGSPSHVYLQMAREVAEVRVSGREPRAVPDHGYMVFQFGPRSRPKLSAFDTSGKKLGTLALRPMNLSRLKRLRRRHGVR